MWRELTGNSSEFAGSSLIGGRVLVGGFAGGCREFIESLPISCRELVMSSLKGCREFVGSSLKGDQELAWGSPEGCREFVVRSIDVTDNDDCKIDSGHRLASSEEGSRVVVELGYSISPILLRVEKQKLLDFARLLEVVLHASSWLLVFARSLLTLLKHLKCLYSLS
ncbi:hypothetical protein BHE74_00013128 [Ensete ventricosum]|nr:hypothetical protein BHE74_00013128 [Ensete ventricosum]